MAINQGFDPNFNKNLNITGKLICNVISTIWNLWFNVRNKTCPADHLTNGTKMDISPRVIRQIYTTQIILWGKTSVGSEWWCWCWRFHGILSYWFRTQNKINLHSTKQNLSSGPPPIWFADLNIWVRGNYLLFIILFHTGHNRPPGEGVDIRFHWI